MDVSSPPCKFNFRPGPTSLIQVCACVGSCSCGQPAAGLIGAQSTGSCYCPDVSPCNNLVDPEVVAVAEEVVVGDEAVERPPDEVDPDWPRCRGHAEVLEVDVGEVAVVEGGQLLPPAGHVAGEERLLFAGRSRIDLLVKDVRKIFTISDLFPHCHHLVMKYSGFE